LLANKTQTAQFVTAAAFVVSVQMNDSSSRLSTEHRPTWSSSKSSNCFTLLMLKPSIWWDNYNWL